MVMQYWLAGSDDNVEAMLRFLISRYCHIESWRGGISPEPIEYPEVGIYHPDIEGSITTDIAKLPVLPKAKSTIGLLLMRSYVLSSDTAHYDAVIKRFQEHNIQVVPAFSGGLDARPAIEKYFKNPKNVQHWSRTNDLGVLRIEKARIYSKKQ